MSRQLRREDYTVGWICALPVELAAAQEMLDEEHADLEREPGDNDENLYALGSICGHNVAIVCLPAGQIGNNPAAAVATQLQATFRSVRFGLMVGIGGGVPSAETDIRLGDVVISQPHQGHGGVVQYDFGKATPSGFQRTGFLNSPPNILLGAVSKLRSNQLRQKTKLTEHIAKFRRLPEFTRESAGPDVLFEAENKVNREPRPNEEPVIHYGTIASGNQVIKHAAERDTVSKEFGGVLCFEMEAAGLMNSFPCLVIRGICDYADAHKHKKWQPYAAGTAAACAKEILSVIPPTEIAKTKPADSHFQSHGFIQANPGLPGVTISNNTTLNFMDKHETGFSQNEREDCLRTLGFLEIDSREQDINPPIENTCTWLFDTAEFKKWQHRIELATNNGVLCIKGKPGAGKSTLMKHTLEHCKNIFPDDLIIAYFFNARGSTLEKTPLGMLRSIVYQLVTKEVTLLDRFLAKFRDKRINSQGHEWKWQQKELKAFITSVIKSWKSRPLLLLVDAMDECNTTDMQDVVDFLELLSIDARKSDTKLRICLSRRHHPPLRIAKCLGLIVEDNKDHREDITTYIKAKLAIQDGDIEDAIKEKARGIFMWVVLVVKLLNKASLKIRGKKKTMQDALEKIPSELEEVFQMLFNKDDEDMAETVLMLQWVLFMRHPGLEAKELYAAVEAGDTDWWDKSQDIDDESIQQSIESLSKGLIEIQGGRRKTVQFIHLSVSDFLLRNKRLQTLDLTLGPDPVTTSHHRLWACCWSYIKPFSGTTIRTREEYKKLNRKYPFLWYATENILGHAEKGLDKGAGGKKDVEIKKWLRDNSIWFEWWRGFTQAIKDVTLIWAKTNGDESLLYVLSLCGFTSLFKCLLAEKGAKGIEVNAQGGEYGNALQAASFNGRQEIVELLLKRGAEVNAQGGYFGNALQAASLYGRQEIVELLLKRGAEVNAQGGKYGNALKAASDGGYQQTVELLIKAGATPIAQNINSEAIDARISDSEGPRSKRYKKSPL